MKVPNISFESFVNSEECKTVDCMDIVFFGLRALLIQKSVKQIERLMS